MTGVIFLDRDGVLTELVRRDGIERAPERPKDFRILPEAPAALGRLHTAGFRLVVVTNQPEVARGRILPEDLDAMHQILADTLPIDTILTCPHEDADGCGCRKPAPGLMLDWLARRPSIPACRYLVGDRWRDIEAGRRAGCRTVLIEREWSGDCTPDRTVRNLTEATSWILKEEGKG